MHEVFSSLDAVWQVYHAIPDLAAPVEVQSSLRRILDDPDLELFWWDWERECDVDVHGEPSVVEDGPGRTVTRLEYGSRKIGAIVHDTRLLDAPSFLDTFIPTMRIAMERDRLHRDLVEKLAQLKASRLRMAEAAEEERRRLQRNLHDGAQQRLVVMLIELRRLEQLTRDDEIGPAVRRVREEAEAAIDDLRDLARGLHPPLLAQRGLLAAVRSGAARSSIPVELDLSLETRLAPTLEAAAYYVCAEAVTNVVKHAQASKVALRIAETGGRLVVEVRDDGVGGATDDDPERTGLRGLRDRVEALDGRLELESEPGVGTTIRAAFPIQAAPEGTAAT
jgi:signal transduction histidine kinase